MLIGERAGREFQDFDQTKSPLPTKSAPASATETAAEVAVDVPVIHVREARAEPGAMEIENANVSKSFVEPAVESARRRVSEETPASEMLKQILPNQPPATSTN